MAWGVPMHSEYSSVSRPWWEEGGRRGWGQVIGKHCRHVFQSSLSRLLLSTVPPLPPTGLLLKREAQRLGAWHREKRRIAKSYRALITCASEVSTINMPQFIVEKTEAPKG